MGKGVVTYGGPYNASKRLDDFAGAVRRRPDRQALRPHPRFPSMSDHAARVIGVTVGEYQKSAELMAKGQLEAWRLYGMDLINTGPGLSGIAEAIGCKLAFPDNTAYVVEQPVNTRDDLDRLKIPDPSATAGCRCFSKQHTRCWMRSEPACRFP